MKIELDAVIKYSVADGKKICRVVLNVGDHMFFESPQMTEEQANSVYVNIIKRDENWY